MTDAVHILPLGDLAQGPALQDGLDRIFFEASNTKSFADAYARAQFRERWLGRYLTNDPQFAFAAVGHEGEIAGYVVGAIDDPALAERFSDIGYFKALSALTRRFPAHLHVNLAPSYRGRGIGGALVARFNAAARSAGAPGVHVVTGIGARNVRFYTGNGFAEVGVSGEGERQVVMLARDLA